jgi:hypothetical protein
MRIILLCFLLASSVWSQTYSAVSVTDISHSAAVIKWTTSSATGTYIKYGLTASYGSVSEATYAAGTAHEWFVSGLDADTLYHYQLCSNSGSCDASDRTFTTAARPTIDPTYPTLPTVPTLPAMPTSWGSTTTITDCAAVQGAINTAAAADGALNHLIEITASLDCSFEDGSGEGFGGGAMLNFPAKSGANSSGTGWIVVRSTGTLPPEGSRVTSDYFTGMPVFRIPPALSEGSGAPTVGTCTAGQVYWNFLTAGWGLYECTVPASNTYALVAKTDFSGAIPSSCANDNSWYYKSDEIDPSSIFWCGGNKLYRLNIGATNAGGNIGFAAGAHHYRISGIRFLSIPLASGGKPSYWTNLYAANLTYSGIVFDLFTGAGVNNVIIERNQIDVSYPYRLKVVAYVGGDDIVIAHNHAVANFNVPTLGDSTGCNSCTSGFVQLAGTERTLIDNNYVDVPGIPLFGTDDVSSGTFDVQVSRNYVTNPAKYIHGRTENTTYCGGCFFPSRHILEIKMGSRWLVEGNQIDQHFASTNNQGDVFSVSSRPGPSRLPIADVWFRKNKIWSAPNLTYVTGHNDGAEQAAATTRVAFTDNLVYDIDGNRVPTGGSAREGRGFRIFYGAEDTIIERNTVLSACTGYAPYLVLNDLGPSEGLQLVRNIASACSVSAPYYFIGRVTTGGGTTGLNAGWPSTGGYSVTGNVFYDAGGGLTGTGYPTGSYWPASLAAVGFADNSALDYRLKYSSTYAPTGAGADVDAIRAAYGEVYNLRALSITSSGATVAYTAPDATTACTVEYGTSATAGTGTRVTDSTGSRFRTKALTGLTGTTLYYFRVYCGQMTSASFTTI